MVLVLDSSGSMRRASEQVVAAAAAFVGALRPEDSMGMLTFADKVDVVHAITTNRANSLEALAGYKAEGGTALYDALCDSMLMLKGLKGRRAVVILTDGRDEDNPGTGPGQHQGLAGRAAPHAGPGRDDVPGGTRHRGSTRSG